MRPWLLALIPTGLAFVACNGSGAYDNPVSDKQADDPCDPGNGPQSSGSAPPVDAGAVPIVLPGGSAGIGFDELRYSTSLSLVMVPGAGTGNLDFVDPSSEKVTAIGGFTVTASAGTNQVGVTSADEGNDVVYAVDRTSLLPSVLDGPTMKVAATAKLASAPGYVRYVAATTEVWVSEPAEDRIEVFTLAASEAVAPVHAAFIAVPGGAESLEVDATHKVAFTNGPSSTFSIATDTARTVGAPWANGCVTAKGIAIDPSNGWVMVACAEGGAIVLDEQTGAMKGKVSTGGGVDRITYDAARLRLYVPTPAKSAMAVVALDPSSGAPTVKGSLDSPSDGHCVVTSGGGELYLCDPSRGELVFVNDPF